MVHDPTVYTKRDLYLGIPNLKKRGVQVSWTEELIEEYKKCADDIEHFARNYVYIVTLDKGKTLIPVIDEQVRVWRLLEANRFIVWVAGRQTFKTTTTAIWLLHSAIFNHDFRILIGANRGKTARGILGRIKEMYRNLPMWLQPGVVEWNKGNIVLDNGTSIVAESTSSEAARGESANIAYIDEMAFIKNDVEFMTSVFPIISSGQNSKFVMTSTMDGVANEFYRYWVEANKGTNGFVPIETKWDCRPDRGPEFKEAMIAKIGLEKWLQEFENVAIAADTALVNVTAAPLVSPKDPIAGDIELRIYEEPVASHSYLLTVDVGYGVGKDYSVIQVLDITGLPYRQVAVFQSNSISPTLLGQKVVEMAIRYNRAYVAIETNDVGQITAQTVHMDLEYENVLMSNFKSYEDFGIKTTAKTKNIGCAGLREMLMEGRLEICDRNTIDELASFERRGNSWGAKQGYHDDTVMPLVMAAYLSKSPDFSYVFGADERPKEEPDEAPDTYVAVDQDSALPEDSLWLLNT